MSMELLSTKRGSTELLHVTIDFSKMREEPEKQRDKGSIDVKKGDYVGEVLRAPRDDHYTHLFLEGIRGHARHVLASAASQLGEPARWSLYGLKPARAAETLADPLLGSWGQFDAYTETMVRVALNVPVRYHDEWMPARCRSNVRGFERETEKLDFKVYWDGAELRKPILFASSRCLVRPFRFDGRDVGAHGYFYAQPSTVRPQELHGLLIRIRNAAIGDYRPSFLGYPPTRASLIQRWISAEVWADDRLEDALNIDRKSFQITHPAYVELQEAIHEGLAGFASDVRRRLYGSGAAQRTRQRAKTEQRRIEDTVEAWSGAVGPQAARHIVSLWEDAAKSPDAQRQLLRRYSVSELYDVVLEVAQDLLDPAQFKRFARALAERLSGHD